MADDLSDVLYAELFRQVAQVILGRLRLLQRPLDQEPKRRPRLLTLLPMPSRLHAARPPARAQRSFGPFPPSDRTKLPLLLPGHFLDRPRSLLAVADPLRLRPGSPRCLRYTARWAARSRPPHHGSCRPH